MRISKQRIHSCFICLIRNVSTKLKTHRTLSFQFFASAHANEILKNQRKRLDSINVKLSHLVSTCCFSFSVFNVTINKLLNFNLAEVHENANYDKIKNDVGFASDIAELSSGGELQLLWNVCKRNKSIFTVLQVALVHSKETRFVMRM